MLTRQASTHRLVWFRTSFGATPFPYHQVTCSRPIVISRNRIQRRHLHGRRQTLKSQVCRILQSCPFSTLLQKVTITITQLTSSDSVTLLMISTCPHLLSVPDVSTGLQCSLKLTLSLFFESTVCIGGTSCSVISVATRSRSLSKFPTFLLFLAILAI